MTHAKSSQPAARAPSSGRGASSALEAMVRQRIPPPGTKVPAEHDQPGSTQVGPKQPS
jgi:hypothetical protein